MQHVASPRPQTYDQSPGRSQQRTPRAKSPDSGYSSLSSGSLSSGKHGNSFSTLGRFKHLLGDKFRSPFNKGTRSSATSIADSSNAGALEPQNCTSPYAKLQVTSELARPANVRPANVRPANARPANSSTSWGDDNTADSSYYSSPTSYGDICDPYYSNDHYFPPSQQEEELQMQSQGSYALSRHQSGLDTVEFAGNKRSGSGHQIVGSQVREGSILRDLTNNHLYHKNVITCHGRGSQFIGQRVVNSNAAVNFNGRFRENEHHGSGDQFIGVCFSVE
ncbi:hypothetical protein F4679DRAFT_545329 [Xylaria curta]|nr:hypothetical protein F4679DRAFT_545329 [Xylaria curta]